MSGQRLRRWSNIKPTSGQCIVFAGIFHLAVFVISTRRGAGSAKLHLASSPRVCIGHIDFLSMLSLSGDQFTKGSVNLWSSLPPLTDLHSRSPTPCRTIVSVSSSVKRSSSIFKVYDELTAVVDLAACWRYRSLLAIPKFNQLIAVLSGRYGAVHYRGFTGILGILVNNANCPS